MTRAAHVIHKVLKMKNLWKKVVDRMERGMESMSSSLEERVSELDTERWKESEEDLRDLER